MPHLYVDISSHGFGHIAQTAPVLNELRRRFPGLRLTVRSGAPREILASRIEGEFAHIPEATDFGMCMESAVSVRVEESAASYATFHRDWAARVANEAARLAALAPDLVLANVSYLALAAAAQAGIPALAMSSLNWADIYRHYCAGRPEAAGIHGQMLDAYGSAEYFMRLTPGMAMPDLRRVRAIGTIARRGENRRPEIDAALGFSPEDKLVLVAMGGVAMRLPMESWPRIPGVRWLVQESWGVRHPDAFLVEQLGFHFTDILRSCDVLITKPGYGSFAEAAVNGVPVLYLSRPDWPEEPCLVEWLTAHSRCLEVECRRLERGEIADELAALWTRPAPEPVAADGAEQAAEILAARLGSLAPDKPKTGNPPRMTRISTNERE